MQKTKEKDGKRYRIFRRDAGETVIHFNHVAVQLNGEELSALSTDVFNDSGGKILIDCSLANYGIVVVHENLAMTPGLIGIKNADEVVDKLIAKVNFATIY